MQEKCGIYKITNKINNKSYIGKSKHIYERWRQHHTEPYNPNARTYNTIFYRAIRKYGLDQFQFEILEECSEEQLNEKEKYWIKKYNTYILEPDSQGYNMTEGGEMTSFQLQYDINLIEKLWKEGKTHQEIREIVNCGQQVLTRYLDYLDIDVSERRKRGSLCKAILQFKMDGTFIQEFSSISEAVRQLQAQIPNINTSNISYACNGKIKSAYGFQWRYKDILNNELKIDSYKIQSFTGYPILQYDKNNNFICEYENAATAAKINNISSPGNITRVCSGKRKTAGGYIWKYKS